MADILSVDKRQEANTALLEVDKGLRSPRLGEQSEAIVKFPALMDRFPFPILINVAFLKLADVFRTGSNLLRLNILKVVQLTEKHINKITSIEEFFKRIYSVIHSNDPIARALTLRMFAATASILCEKKTVHHSIQSSLESHDQVEVEAAIFATDALCEQSSVFAAGVYVKIADMVLGLKTPPTMKLKAVIVFRKMHHSLEIASKVREVCLQVLESHPTLTFFSVLLPTLTKLAIATLVQASEQVELLLRFAEEDVRKSVRHLALIDLYELSVKTPQCWEMASIEKLVLIMEKSHLVTEKEIGCCILYHLSSSIAIQHLVTLEDVIKPFCYGVSSPVARAYATACCCNIVKCLGSVLISEEVTGDDSIMEVEDTQQNNNNNNGLRLTNLVLLAVDIIVTEEFEGISSKSIKALLSCLGDIANKLFVKEELIVSLLSQLYKLPDDCYSVLCSTVVKMAANTEKHVNEGDKIGGEKITQHLLKILQNRESDTLLLPVSHMLMELHSGIYSSDRYTQFTNSVQPILVDCVWSANNKDKFWIAYRIARRGTKRGFHRMAGKIYEILQRKVNEPKFKKWLQTLEEFSQAQCIITDAEGDPSQLILSLQTASSFLYDCTLLVKGATPPSSLPIQFLPCLANLLDLYSQLLSLCIRYRSFFPPSLVSQGSPLSKFREISGQFRSISKLFSSLLHSLFDVDPHTLQYIQLLQQSCNLMSNIISEFLSPQKPLLSPMQSVSTPILSSVSTPLLSSVPVSLETTDNFDTRHTLGVVCNQVLSVAQSTSLRLQMVPFSFEHLSVIEESALSLLDVPFLLPPSFFLSYQSTSIQLALSPPIPANSKPVTLTLGSHLALKVEGVVEHYGKRIYRSPVSALISVKPQVDRLFDSSFKTPMLQDLDETRPVKNDYYIAEFLFGFPFAGVYILRIDNSLVDHEGRIWHTGPSIEMNVLVDTDEKLELQQRQQQQSSSTNNSNGHHKNSNSTQW